MMAHVITLGPMVLLLGRLIKLVSQLIVRNIFRTFFKSMGQFGRKFELVIEKMVKSNPHPPPGRVEDLTSTSGKGYQNTLSP